MQAAVSDAAVSDAAILVDIIPNDTIFNDTSRSLTITATDGRAVASLAKAP